MSESKPPRVRGIGGIFFRAPDPAATRAWYGEHLGLQVDEYGTNFEWRQAEDPDAAGYSQWSPFSDETEYFGAPNQAYMINYRVDNLPALLENLRAAGVKVIGEIQKEDYGSFAHVEDCDGVRLELWEPIDDEYAKIVGKTTR